MLKLEDIGKKLKSDLNNLIIGSIIVSFLGGLFGFGILGGFKLIYCILIPAIAYILTLLLEREIFKYWNSENDLLLSYHLTIAVSFISSILFTILFANHSLVLTLILIGIIIFISIRLFFNYYKGYVECLAHQMSRTNKNVKTKHKTK
jgi:hypothetical protein